MSDSFEPEMPTNPDTNRPRIALLDVYDIAKKGADQTMVLSQRVDAMDGKLDRALAPVAFPRAPLYLIALTLVVIALGIFTSPHAALAR